MTQNILKELQNAAQYHILILGDFDVFSFLRSSKLTRFLITCLSATSFQRGTFSAILYISETTRTNFLKISSHNLHNVHKIRSETFIEINSLQHPKISRQTYPTNLSKICVKTFTVLTLS